MSQTFIAKYKPYFLSEFNTDPQLVSVIRTFMELGDLNMLFVGNASTGKTTLLYAILRDYYGLGRDDSFPELNIMFINNLKEQGINYFRNEMKTFSQSHCSIRGKKKFIVIDDIDTINEQSQQVFRNYIDKYNNNIHFIASCTNVQKVIESMQSRLHMVNISPPTAESVAEIADRIIALESIIIDADSRDFILDKSNIRTVINNLEKIAIYGRPMTLQTCSRLCSTISLKQFEDYICALHERDLKKAIGILYDINDYGYSVIDILEFFFSIVKTTQLLTEEEKYDIIPVLCKYISIFHSLHEDSVELALFTNSVLNTPTFLKSATAKINEQQNVVASK